MKQKLKFRVRFLNGEVRPLLAVNEFQARKMAEGIAKKNHWIIASFGKA